MDARKEVIQNALAEIIAWLRAEKIRIDGELETMQRIQKRYNTGNESPLTPFSVKAEAVTVPASVPYANIKGTQKAVERFLKDNAGRKFKASEIVDGLAQAGFQIKGNQPISIVLSTAKRLCARNERVQVIQQPNPVGKTKHEREHGIQYFRYVPTSEGTRPPI